MVSSGLEPGNAQQEQSHELVLLSVVVRVSERVNTELSITP